MRRQPNMVKSRAVKSLGKSISNVARPWIKPTARRSRPSRMGEVHLLGLPETAGEVSYGSSVPNPITYETADDVSPADELSLETITPAEESSDITKAQIIDEVLIYQPTPRRTNSTTIIHPKIDMEYAVEYEGSVLYEKQKDQWVAEPLPRGSLQLCLRNLKHLSL